MVIIFWNLIKLWCFTSINGVRFQPQFFFITFNYLLYNVIISIAVFLDHSTRCLDVVTYTVTNCELRPQPTLSKCSNIYFSCLLKPQQTVAPRNNISFKNCICLLVIGSNNLRLCWAVGPNCPADLLSFHMLWSLVTTNCGILRSRQ